MKDSKQIPKGFKPSLLGLIPDDWDFKKIGDIADLKGGYAFDSSRFEESGKYQVVKMSNLYDHNLNLERSNSFLNDLTQQEKEFLLSDGDILITLTGTVGKKDYGYSYQINGETNLLLNQRVAKITARKFFDHRYLYYAIKTTAFLNQFFLSARGGTGNQANVGTVDLATLKVLFPPLNEQTAIANLLGAWDKAINTLTQLIAQKEQRKKWLVQQLLTGKKRLKGFNGEWKEYHLGDFFDERNETNYVNLPLISIGQSGVYPQSESDKKDNSNEDKSKYRRICKGDIGYNTMRMWQGRSALSGLEGIVSPAYTILKPKKNADSLFFSYLFKLPKLVNSFFRNSQGLVEDTLNCKYKDFAIVKVHVPQKEEQIAIAKIIQETEKELRKLSKKVDLLNEQKKGLMQILLTAKKRLM